MAEDGYRGDMVYAGEQREEQPPSQQPKVEEKTEEKKRKMSDWALVAVAAVGLILTIYYVGFEHLKAPINLWPNATNQSQPNTTIPIIPQPNITYGVVSAITYAGNNTTFVSREDANLSLQISCSALCRGLYVSIYDGSNKVGEFQNSSSWNGTKDIVIQFSVPKRDNAPLSLSVFADSASINNTLYGANAEEEAMFYLNVLASVQKIIYGKEFYLDLGETGNLTDLNATLTLASLQNGVARIDVKDKTGMTFSSNLETVNKPNATFFDFLTLALLEPGTTRIKLIAWPDGVLEALSLVSPFDGNISASGLFQVYVKCTGTCAGTYIGVFAYEEPKFGRIYLYNQTSAWNGYKIVNITGTVPTDFQNKTIAIMVRGSTRNLDAVSYIDWQNPPEKTWSKQFFVQG
jgi:hypothetical protein